mmetsp:Transcript_20770/g.31561  ORF Transcript_20770/g.31561 Transcript_20770/m.31561 type:complete len:82 (-) Transcript_20770:55-300(-)
MTFLVRPSAIAVVAERLVDIVADVLALLLMGAKADDFAAVNAIRKHLSDLFIFIDTISILVYWLCVMQECPGSGSYNNKDR